MQELLRALWRDESGQDLAEYVMLIALIAIVAVAGVTALGGTIVDTLEEAAATLFDDGGGV